MVTLSPTSWQVVPSASLQWIVRGNTAMCKWLNHSIVFKRKENIRCKLIMHSRKCLYSLTIVVARPCQSSSDKMPHCMPHTYMNSDGWVKLPAAAMMHAGVLLAFASFLTYAIPRDVAAAFSIIQNTGAVCFNASARTLCWNSFRKLPEEALKVDTFLEHNLLHSSSMINAMAF